MQNEEQDGSYSGPPSSMAIVASGSGTTVSDFRMRKWGG